MSHPGPPIKELLDSNTQSKIRHWLPKSEWLYVWLVLLHKCFTYDPIDVSEKMCNISLHIYVTYMFHIKGSFIYGVNIICYICTHTHRGWKDTDQNAITDYLWIVGLQMILFSSFCLYVVSKFSTTVITILQCTACGLIKNFYGFTNLACLDQNTS